MASLVVKSKLSIGTSSATPLTDTYANVLGITEIGDYGDEAEIVKYSTIDTGRVSKLKGVRDGSTFEFTLTREMADAGQIALRAAALSDGEFNVKVEAADRPATGASPKPTTVYLRGLIQEKHKHGSANDVVSQTFTVELTAAPNVVPASAT